MEHLLEDFPSIKYSAAKINNEADVPDFLRVLDYAVCHDEHRDSHMELLESLKGATEDRMRDTIGLLDEMEQHQQLVFACETTIGDEKVRGIVAFLASSVEVK